MYGGVDVKCPSITGAELWSIDLFQEQPEW